MSAPSISAFLISPLLLKCSKKQIFSPTGCDVDLGGFAGLFDLKAAGFTDPLLACGTDGVGTKLKVIRHLCE